MRNRDNFSKKTIDLLKDRVGGHCSNPDCGCETTGPSDGDGITNLGIACHICAAAPGGPRYDSSQTVLERKNYSNGIWLCSICSKLIDDNPLIYSREVLNKWKSDAEYRQLARLTKSKIEAESDIESKREILRKINSLIYEVFEITKYAHNYVVMNFANVSKFEIQNQIDERPSLHKQSIKYIASHIDLMHRLFKTRNKYALDLSVDLNNLLEEFSHLFEFTYMSDGGLGLDDDFASSMLVNLYDNFSEIEKRRNNILNQLRNEYHC